MFVEYIPLIIMVLFGFAIAVIFLFLSEWLGAKRSTKAKQSTYESGMEPVGTARRRYSVKFYMVAVSFIIFDIEIIFLYPWVVQFKELGLIPFFANMFFMIILFVGYIYEFKKGGLDWD